MTFKKTVKQLLSNIVMIWQFTKSVIFNLEFKVMQIFLIKITNFLAKFQFWFNWAISISFKCFCSIFKQQVHFGSSNKKNYLLRKRNSSLKSAENIAARQFAKPLVHNPFFLLNNKNIYFLIKFWKCNIAKSFYYITHISVHYKWLTVTKAIVAPICLIHVLRNQKIFEHNKVIIRKYDKITVNHLQRFGRYSINCRPLVSWIFENIKTKNIFL